LCFPWLLSTFIPKRWLRNGGTEPGLIR
jgi:hypothetical protein